MAIDDNTLYGLTGAQIKELPGKIEAIKGMARELTSANYNYPVGSPDGVALWKLPKGLYYTEPGVKKYISTSKSERASETILIGIQDDTNVSVTIFGDGVSIGFMRRFSINSATGVEGTSVYSYGLTNRDIIDSLTSTATDKALSANQGKVLNDKIGGDLTNLITTDKTSLINAINEVAGQGGGGGVIELTTADYNYPTDNPDCIALWLLDEGNYFISYDGSNLVDVKMSTGRRDSISSGYYIVSHFTESGSGRRQIEGFYNNSGVNTARLEIVASNGNYLGGVFMNAPGVVQNTGTSTTAVMSQNAVTGMIFADPSTKYNVQIGATSDASGDNAIAIGRGAYAVRNASAIGMSAQANAQGSVAIGFGSEAHAQGEFNIGTVNPYNGYNNSNYRLLTGLYDPQNAHDAATKGYVDTSISAIGAGTRRASNTGWNTSMPLDYYEGTDYRTGGSNASGTMFEVGKNVSDQYIYVGIGALPDTPDVPYWMTTAMTTNGTSTGYPNSYRLAKLSEVPTTFTTNEWNALWA